MAELIEINQGEIVINFNSPKPGKITFKELGLTNEQLKIESGFLRIKIDLSNTGKLNYFAVPTVEVAYFENCAETHWQCEFNDETILDKLDHHGHSTVLLMDRKKLTTLEHRHENKLIVHAEFPEPVHLDAENSYINLFK